MGQWRIWAVKTKFSTKLLISRANTVQLEIHAFVSTFVFAADLLQRGSNVFCHYMFQKYLIFSFYFVFSGKPRKTYLKLRKTNGAPLGGTFKGAPVISWVILFLVQGIQVLVINLSVWWSVSVDLKIFEFLSSSIESQISSQLYVSVWKTMMSLWRFKSLFTHLR